MGALLSRGITRSGRTVPKEKELVEKVRALQVFLRHRQQYHKHLTTPGAGSIKYRSPPGVKWVLEDFRDQELFINGKQIKFMIDTGADICAMRRSALPEGVELVDVDGVYMYVFGGLHYIKQIAEVDMALAQGYGSIKVQIVVLEDKHMVVDAVLGLEIALTMGFVTRSRHILDSLHAEAMTAEVLTGAKVVEAVDSGPPSDPIVEKIRQDAQAWLALNAENAEGKFKDEACGMELVWKDGKPPQDIRRPPPQKFNEKILTALKEFVQNGLKEGWIVQASDIRWCHRVVAVPKPDGTYRFCLDFRALNEKLTKNLAQTRSVDEAIAFWKDKTLFTELDLSNAFHHVVVKEKDSMYLGFVVDGKTYRYVRAPFGLHFLTVLFAQHMERVLAGLPHVICYVDNVVVATERDEDHGPALQAVIQRLTEAGLKLKPSKCKVAMREAKLLGVVVGNGTIKPDPARVDAILKAPAPKGPKELATFLGVVNFIRPFIAGLADAQHPLNKLRSCDKSAFVWTDEHQQAFEDVKKAVAAAIVLHTPTPNSELILYTDASDRAIAGALCYVENKEELEKAKAGKKADVKVVALFSKSLQGYELDYSVYRKELYAILMSLRQFHSYLYGRHFTLLSDNAGVVKTHSMINLSHTITNWMSQITSYNFTITHLPGADNIVADALSRSMATPPPDAPAQQQMSDDETTEPIQQQQQPLPASAQALFQPDSPELGGEIGMGLMAVKDRKGKINGVDNHNHNHNRNHDKSTAMNIRHRYNTRSRNQIRINERAYREALKTDQTDAVALFHHPAHREVGGADGDDEQAESSPQQQQPELSQAQQLDPSDEPPSVPLNAVQFKNSRRYKRHNGVGTPSYKRALTHLICQGYEIPETDEERTNYVRVAHDEAGHGSLEFIVNVLRDVYNVAWPGMHLDAAQCCQDCLVCLKWNRSALVYYPAQSIRAYAPWTYIQFDLAEVSTTTTEGGAKHLMIVVDLFTRFTFAFSLVQKDAHTIADVLHELFAVEGVPAVVYCDQEFHGDVYKVLFETYEIQTFFSTPYHKKTNGVVERAIQSYQDVLRKLQDREQQDWPNLLPLASMMINNRRAQGRNLSPFELFRGRPPRLLRDWDLTKLDDKLVDKWVAHWRRMYDHVYPRHLTEMEKTLRKQNETLDRKRRVDDKVIPSGTKVMIANEAYRYQKQSSQPPWMGPFVVVSTGSWPGRYIVADAGGRVMAREWLREEIKECANTEVPLRFQVDHVYNHDKLSDGTYTYAVRWKGYPPSCDSWQPQGTIDKEFVDVYWATLRQGRVPLRGGAPTKKETRRLNKIKSNRKNHLQTQVQAAGMEEGDE